MSFYVTLPSSTYATGSTSEFTTILATPIKLNQRYKVALVELTYNHSWKMEQACDLMLAVVQIRFSIGSVSVFDDFLDFSKIKEFDEGQRCKTLFHLKIIFP